MGEGRSVYRRTFAGLIKKAKSKATAIKYPNFKVGDRVRAVNDLLLIDERITGVTDGYVGEQVRRRIRYRYLVRNSIRGKVLDIKNMDLYIQFKIPKGDEKFAEKYGLNKPLLMYKQMVKPVKKKKR